MRHLYTVRLGFSILGELWRFQNNNNRLQGMVTKNKEVLHNPFRKRNKALFSH